MKEIIQWIQRTGLFLLGVAMVVWGYRVNATGNAKVNDEESAQKEKPTAPTSIFGSISPDSDNTDGAKQQQVSNNKTVIESDKAVEESSGTE